MSLSDDIKALLLQLFSDLGSSEQLGDEVLAYMCAGLEEGDNEPDDADELADMLAGFSTEYGRLPASKQQQLAGDLLARVRGLKQHAAAAPPAAPAAAPAAAKPSLKSVAAEALSRLESLSVSSSAGSSEQEESEGEGAAASEAQRQAVAVLRELCSLPDAADGFLAHVLAAKGGGDVEAAAAWMLECEDLAGAQAAWREARAAARAQRAAARAERAAVKSQIVSRFQLLAVPNGGTGAKGKPPALKAWGDGGGENGGRVRFRDGVAVSSRGEKFVYEKPAEWDGGSRGKVYTKGKRGKGFV